MRIAPFARLGLALSLVVAACGDDDNGNGTGDAGPGDVGGPSGFVLRFHRVAPVAPASYDGWTVILDGDVEETSVALDSVDDFGGVFQVPLSAGASSFSYQFTDGEDTEPSDPATVDLTVASGEAWHWQGGSQPMLEAPPAVPGSDEILFYYFRPGGDYGEGDTQYGIYTWGDAAPMFSWPDRAFIDGIADDMGAYYLIDLAGESSGCPFGDFCFIVQAGSDATKDPGVDRGLDTTEDGNQFFLSSGVEAIYTCPERRPACILGAGSVDIENASAHFLRRGVMAVDFDGITPDRVELRYSPTAEVEVEGIELQGGTTVELTEDGSLSGELAEQFPHLSTFMRYTLPESAQADVEQMLQSQMVVGAFDEAGVLLGATKVQPAGVIDELYTYDGPLGLDFSGDPDVVRVWAPTAQNVRLEIFDTGLAPVTTAEMSRSEQGVWAADIDAAWLDGFYRYEVTVYHPITGDVQTYSVTDPYSKSLSTNSEYTQIVDVLNDPGAKPEGWDALVPVPLDAPEDLTIYELHIRDFSIDDETVPEADRGKYTAFTYNGVGGAPLSDGMSHLRDLADSGLTLLHVLPTFDIATVNEDREERVEITDGFDRLCSLSSAVPENLCTQYGTTTIETVLEGIDPLTTEAQEILGYMRDLDGFNWGYDPYHYDVPEGSYATDPNGLTRVREIREMVRSLNEIGLRAALDVVYNHTNSSGVAPQSVLDKVVPWYYHRQNPRTGFVVTETCCQDTATEHNMMEKHMIDSVIHWAKAYKMTAFRFDLMGYHLKRNMEALQAAVRALTVAEDGIDGSEIYIYGEGWTPGSEGSSRGTESSPNATQLTLGGTGIGTFSDRLRDAARGGGPFDSGMQHVRNQGFINGMSYDPNDPTEFDESSSGRNPSSDLNSVLLQGDQIRVGLAGNLEDFRLVDRQGNVVEGSDVSYNGQPTGYTTDPQEVVTYVEKHDNETLFDISNYKVPLGTDMPTRVRIQNLGVDLTVLSQGVPFFHAGMDLLRSKSMDRNSFNSGDWFNRIDWTGERVNFRIGFPPQADNMPSYDEMDVVFRDESIAPVQSNVQSVAAHFREMLQVRYSTPLFRLRTGDEVKQRVDFHNTGPDQTPGFVVMSVTDGTDCPANVPDLDPAHDAVLVLFNANDEAQAFELTGASGWALHPVQSSSVDAVVRMAEFSNGTFSVPGRTTAVFVQAQDGGQGPGLPCNTR
jgi:pullulanase-type alpha-1,6-glucosidase